MKIRPYGRVFFWFARHGRAAGGRAGGKLVCAGRCWVFAVRKNRAEMFFCRVESRAEMFFCRVESRAE